MSNILLRISSDWLNNLFIRLDTSSIRCWSLSKSMTFLLTTTISACTLDTLPWLTWHFLAVGRTQNVWSVLTLFFSSCGCLDIPDGLNAWGGALTTRWDWSPTFWGLDWVLWYNGGFQSKASKLRTSGSGGCCWLGGRVRCVCVTWCFDGFGSVGCARNCALVEGG